MTYEEFENKYCHFCGTQRCMGIYDEVCREGCAHYKRECLGEKENRMKCATCHVCNGSGVYSKYEQCPRCCGFGTIIIYGDNEYD